MIRYFCDICGKAFLFKQSDQNKINFVISSLGIRWDLCQECRDAISDVIKKRKLNAEEEDNQSFSEKIEKIYNNSLSKSNNKTIVQEWRKNNLHGRKADCRRDTGLSRPTIDKYWNA